MRRRRTLALLGTAVAALAGCVGNSTTGDGPPSSTDSRNRSTGVRATTDNGRADAPTSSAAERTTTGGETATERTTERAGTTCEPPAVSDRWVRCRGDPVSVSKSVVDDPGYDDDLEYYPGNDTVRVVVAVAGDEPAAFENWSFERWSKVEAASIAVDRVRSATDRRLGSEAFGSGLGTVPDAVDPSSNAFAVRLRLVTRYEDCETTAPPTTLSSFADLAPRAANVTVSLDGETFSGSVPVYAREVLDRGGFG
jgi:hypothetical protein